MRRDRRQLLRATRRVPASRARTINVTTADENSEWPTHSRIMPPRTAEEAVLERAVELTFEEPAQQRDTVDDLWGDEDQEEQRP